MEKKDFGYIITLLMILIIGIFTFFFGGKENDIVSYLGFAGTITSIIMSVVAVIYTFYQSTTTVTQAQKLSETSEKFDKAFVELQKTQAHFSASLECIESLGTKVDKVDSRVMGLEGILLDKSSAPSVDTQISEYTTTISAEKTELILNSISLMGLATLYLCIRQVENPKPKALKDIIEDLEKLEIAYPYKLELYYVYGFIVGICPTNIMSTGIYSDPFTVHFNNVDLCKKLLLDRLSFLTSIKENCASINPIIEGINKLYSE